MEKTIAILGASSTRSKYGNKAVRAFVRGGWTVYPVNPKADFIEGVRCYASLADVPQPLHRISLYLPPAVGIALLPEIARTPHDELYLNPGSEDAALLAEAEALGLKPIQACSIVNIGMAPSMFGDT